MTWVFGTATEFFGTAICVADIQVTFGEGEEREMIDCLQKVYPLEQNLVAGFAGNVQVCFSMLAALQEAVREVADEYGEPADFDRVLERFSPFAARAWGGLGPHLQEGGCELLVAGASLAPQTLYNSHPRVVRMRAPAFEVEEIPRGTWGSIGSGTDVAGYRAELERLSSGDNSGALQMEVGRPGGFAHTMFTSVLFEVFEMQAEEGISKHFHYVTVTANGYEGGTSNREFFPADGPAQKIAMPPVATNWGELQEILKQRNGLAPAWARA